MFVAYFTCTLHYMYMYIHDSLPPSLLHNSVLSHSTTGAIELPVFSEYYHIELDVVDVQSQRIDRFGEWLCAILVVTKS